MAGAQQPRIDAAGTIPHGIVRSFAAWDGHGCSASTHRAYVRLVQMVFSEGVSKLGLWPQSTLAEAIRQLRGSSADTNGFIKASLRKLIRFLELSSSGTRNVGHNESCAGSKQAAERLVKKRSASAGTALLPASKISRSSAADALSPGRARSDRLLATMEDLLRWIASQDEAAPFRAPVSELYAPAQIPGYDTRVRRRMDLRTVAQKLARQEYREAGVERFRADVCLCFLNCISYVPNPSDPFFRRAVSLLKRWEIRFAEQMSTFHMTAHGGAPIDAHGRRQPASVEQRRILRAAARRGAGCVLLPFVALSEYYRPDPRLRAGFAVTRRTHERKQLASELRTALVPKSIRAATSVPAAPAIEQNDTWHQATARGVTEVNAAAEHKRAASPKAAAPANKCRNFRRWSPDQDRELREAVAATGPGSWSKKAAHLSVPRNAAALRLRWKHLEKSHVSACASSPTTTNLVRQSLDVDERANHAGTPDGSPPVQATSRGMGSMGRSSVENHVADSLLALGDFKPLPGTAAMSSSELSLPVTTAHSTPGVPAGLDPQKQNVLGLPRPVPQLAPKQAVPEDSSGAAWASWAAESHVNPGALLPEPIEGPLPQSPAVNALPPVARSGVLGLPSMLETSRKMSMHAPERQLSTTSGQ